MTDIYHHITLGRMNPITKGHEMVVNHVINSAKKDNAGHTIILTSSHDKEKNPLTPEQKLTHAKNAFPNANIKIATKQQPSMLHHVSDLHKKGVTHLTVHVGSDRVDEFTKLLNKYNGVKGKHGFYNFKKIKIVPVGNKRKEKGEGVESASATAMRKHAMAGNKEQFDKMAPSTMSKEHKDKMYNDVRKGMEIKEGSLRFKNWIMQ